MKKTPLKRSNKPIKGSNNPLKKTKSYIKAITKKKQVEKQEQKEKRNVYFDYHIKNIKNNSICCEECGDKLKGDISEIAHIISKSKNPEVEDIKDNIVYLCGVNSDNQCHSKFDQSLNKRETMSVFSKAVKRFNLFKDKIVNTTNEVRHIINFKV